MIHSFSNLPSILKTLGIFTLPNLSNSHSLALEVIILTKLRASLLVFGSVWSF